MVPAAKAVSRKKNVEYFFSCFYSYVPPAYIVFELLYLYYSRFFEVIQIKFYEMLFYKK